MRKHYGVPRNDRFLARAAALILPLICCSSATFAAECGTSGISAKFGEAAALCGGSTDANQPVNSLMDMPRSVSISMPVNRSPRANAYSRGRAAPASALIRQVAARHRIDPALLAAMVRAESRCRTNAVSNKGALGLMQVMPATARSMGIADPNQLLNDPALALETGARYLKTLQYRLGNNVPLVVAAYNAGPGAVTKAGMRVPAYRETQAYVGQVMGSYLATRTAITATR